MLDYEMKQSYTVTVTATDPSLESAVITVTIKITDVDEAPEISKKSLVIGGRRSIDYLENGESQVATYTAAGRQAAGATWRLAGEDGADFSITTGGVLSFDAPPDYENPADRNEDNEYRITLHASDPGGNTAELGVTVRVANVDEEGTVTLSPAQPYVGAEITAAITDPDGGVAGAMWQWARSPDGLSDWTDITDATLETYTPAEDDVDSYLRAMVSYGDAESVGKGAEAVSDAPVGTNRAPEFPASETGQRTVPDSTAPAGNVGDPVVATDPDEDTLTYTLGPVLDSGGDPVSDTANDPDSFAIDSGTGQITVGTGTTLNARTKDTYTVLVTATDPSDESDTITVTITVTLDLFNRYDLNNNGRIDKPEVLDAIDDYFAFLIPKDDVLDVIDLYFSG